MHKTVRVILGATTAALLTSFTATTHAAGFPSEKQCTNKDNPPTEALTKGACAIVVRTKGNCMACHQIDGLPSGNVATQLKGMKQRYAGADGKQRLRAQVEDSRKANPKTIMPPFGAHGILSKDEIDNLVDFLLTL